MGDVRRIDGGSTEQAALTLDDLAREGARRMIVAALEAEVSEYVTSFTEELDENGKRLVVRNGRARERRLTVGSGTVGVRAPRVNDKRVDGEGERQKFSSQILPAYARRSPKVTDLLPVLYLRGLSTGDFAPALRDLLGEDASGLSASSISRMTKQWEADHAAFKTRSLRFHRYAYLFVDGVHMSVRLGEDGEKELLAVEDGYRESTDSWAAVLRDLRERGMNEPKLVSGDGALGAWAALRDVFPEAKEQRCWVHKTANVLDALPKRLQPRAKGLLHEMAEAPGRTDAEAALGRFRSEFDAKYPKAVAKLDKDWTQLSAFFDFPAEHWRHLRTTNPIESSFATVRLRTRVTKGAGSKAAALAMAYKLLDAAQERWRRFNGHELVAEVLDGVRFKDGVRVKETDHEREDEKVAA
ncbi:MAG: IS256 family transposase [Solirubrobacterales bacterium]|nr:IS256 family transposase [Solirubrobacterales bacterium]